MMYYTQFPGFILLYSKSIVVFECKFVINWESNAKSTTL